MVPATRPSWTLLLLFALSSVFLATAFAATQESPDRPQEASGQLGADYPHGAFREQCSLCHTSDDWSTIRKTPDFDHSKTGFPLVASHASANCLDCHQTLEFKAVSAECVACHVDVHKSEFGTDCAQCHGSRSFVDRGEQLAMHRLTQFPLTGSHGTLDCDQCHRATSSGLEFVTTPTECYACHRDNFASTSEPDHTRAGFSTDCTDCHGTTGWIGGNMGGAHEFFPLTGGHGGIDCQTCHTGGRFTALDTQCVSCHQNAYDSTTDPVHASAGFSTECGACHTINAWNGAMFDHGTTNFDLTGAHRSAACGDCHTQSSYAATSSECYACHQSEYTSAVDPNHITAGFPTDCEQCHSTSSWSGASFDHALSGFPLVGAHLAVECTACHANNVYTGTPTDCFACHQADYASTVDPSHTAAGFSTDCQPCHNEAAWVPATFNHNQTTFALTGAHLSAPCVQCHVGGVYAGTSTDCYVCHRQEYDATANPAHGSAGFGTDCVSCHGTSTWMGATFDHDQSWFPIYSGKHLSRWQECSECHTNMSNYSVYDCINCHPHDDKAKVDGDHRGENGYRYDSVGCYDCHPRGRS